MRSKPLMNRFRRGAAGASAEALADAARTLNVVFPPDYVAFMSESNGGEGPVEPHGYLVLWPVEQLVPMNEGYMTAEFFPHWAFIGSDGGSEAVAVKRGSEPTVAFLPFIGSEEDALVRGHSLDDILLSFATKAN